MSAETLYQLLDTNAEPKRTFFGRRHCVLAYREFQSFEEHFRRSRNILNRYENLRTIHWFRHIHVMKKGDVVEFHLDYANPDKGILMALTHLFVDVLPYFGAKLFSRTTPAAR